MKFIHLGHDNFAVVDEDDFLKIQHLIFCKGSHGYAVKTNDRKNPRLLHKIIFTTPKNKFIDHINNNKLDNRKINIRFVTRSENNRNVANKRGTFFHKKTGKWWAMTRIDKKLKYIGCSYQNEEEAHQAYVEFSKTLSTSYFHDKPSQPPIPTTEEKKTTIHHRQKLREQGQQRSYEKKLKRSAKPVTNNLNEIFRSTNEACRKYDIPKATLRYWLKQTEAKGNSLGWKYVTT